MAQHRSPSRDTRTPTPPPQILGALHPGESSAVLHRLLAAHPELGAEAEGIAKVLLAETSFEQIATEVEDALSGMDDDDVYGRAGRKAWGHLEPDEAAVELLEEAIKPFACDMQRRLSLGKEDEALRIAQGMLLGLYRVRGEACNAALQEATDFAEEMAASVLDEWSRGGLDARAARRARCPTRVLPPDFVEKHVPEWGWLLPRARGRTKANRQSPGKGTRGRS